MCSAGVCIVLCVEGTGCPKAGSALVCANVWSVRACVCACVRARVCACAHACVLRYCVQNLLCLACGCSVHAFPEIKYGKRIHVLPFDDSMEGLTG